MSWRGLHRHAISISRPTATVSAPRASSANRGDRLRLTFSTRDTGQSFFLQDYDLHVSITPGNRMVSVQRLSRPDDPPVLMETVEIVAGLPGWQGWLVSKSQFRNHTYNGPLHGTERGELIVSPNFLLYGALGLLVAIPFAGLLLTGRRDRRGSDRRPLNLFARFPWLKRVVKAPSFQFNLALPMLGVFWLIILTGLFGTKVAGRNAGPMIIWVLWLSALIILLVPIGGRIWCTVCPLPLLGEWLQRLRLTRNPAELEGKSPRRIFGVPLIWPAWLSNAWPRVLLFLLLGTFSTTIVALPPATSWMLIGLVVLAIAHVHLSGAAIVLPVPLPDQQLHQPLLHDRACHGAVRLLANLLRLSGEVLSYRQRQRLGMPLRALRG